MKNRRHRPEFLLALGSATAERMVEILRASGIPAFVDPRTVPNDQDVELRMVGVPPRSYLQARSLLVERRPDLVVRARVEEDPVFDLAEDEVRQPADALFQELAPGGVTDEKVRRSLVEFYLRADAGGRKRALEAIDLLAEFRAPTAIELLEVVCRRDLDEERLWELAGFLARISASADLGPILALLRDPQPAIRARAAMALGRMGDEALLPELVRLYGDPSPAVQAEAADSVWRIAGEDDGFDPDLPAQEKTRIQEEWRSRLR